MTDNENSHNQRLFKDKIRSESCYTKKSKIGLALGLLGAAMADAPLAEGVSVSFDIPAQPASSALIAFGEQANITVLLDNSLRDIPLPGLQGEYTVEEAIKLLLKDIDIRYRVNPDSIIVSPPLPKKENVRRKNTLWSAIAATFLSAFSSGAMAVEEDKYTDAGQLELEEIIVTARKRAEDMQNVPISVTAFSAEKMEMQSVANLRDVARFAPSLVVSNTGGSPNQGAIFIRGVGEPEQFTTADPAVGVYVDGVYHGRAQGSVMDLLDLERVEVLRGPQGTLFGRNAIGGAVNLVSVAPNEETMTRLMLTYGNHERIEAGVSVNAPLIDNKLYARATIKHTERDCLAKTVNRGCLPRRYRHRRGQGQLALVGQRRPNPGFHG